jgi:phosphate transport system ATP-binding protein
MKHSHLYLLHIFAIRQHPGADERIWRFSHPADDLRIAFILCCSNPERSDLSGPLSCLSFFMNTTKIFIENLFFSYNDHHILCDVAVRIAANTITAIVGPSGIGKSTFLTTLNRLWETIPGARLKGRVEIQFGGRFQNIYDHHYPLTRLRRQVGMVFQTPNPLPMSISKNVSFPLYLAGYRQKGEMADRVEQALKRAFLWEEVKDRLTENALVLSGGQQQRLCIARALILEPDVLLLDEPTSSLDAKAAAVIEGLLVSLKENCTLIIVSHYWDQVQRIADTVFELTEGKLVPATTPA